VDVIVPTPAKAAEGSASDRSANLRNARVMVVSLCAHIIPNITTLKVIEITFFYLLVFDWQV
jgi:hypothetical protein